MSTSVEKVDSLMFGPKIDLPCIALIMERVRASIELFMVSSV